MVCLGNICRSPVAEGIVRHLINEQGLDWEVASAGTGNWHIGDPADHRSIAIANRYGYDISEQRAQHFDKQMFDDYDHILVMDKNNLRDVLKLTDQQEHHQKVHLFLPDGEVTDPYFDDQLFDPVFKEIERRAKELIEELKG